MSTYPVDALKEQRQLKEHEQQFAEKIRWYAAEAHLDSEEALQARNEARQIKIVVQLARQRARQVTEEARQAREKAQQAQQYLNLHSL